MKNKLVIAIATSLLMLSGCATMPQGSSIDKVRTMKAAGIGCAAGAVLGRLIGDKDDLVKGCAAGAISGAIASYRSQLQEARAIEAAAKEAGLQTELKMKTVQVEQEQVQALDALVINYKAEDLKKMDAKTSQVFDKLASLANSAKNELTFKVEGADHSICLIPIYELSQRKVLSSHKVDEKCGAGSYKMTITPIPQLDK